MLFSKKAFLFTIICISFLIILNTQKSVAQSIAIEPVKKTFIMGGQVSFVAPGGSKKAGKKLVKQYQPAGYSQATGYDYRNGSSILFYHTTIDWVDGDDGMRVWKLSSTLVDRFPFHKYMGSGYYDHEGSSSVTYYMKISFKDKERKVYALLTFSDLTHKLLYGVYISPIEISEDWVNSLEINLPDLLNKKQGG